MIHLSAFLVRKDVSSFSISIFAQSLSSSIMHPIQLLYESQESTQCALSAAVLFSTHPTTASAPRLDTLRAYRPPCNLIGCRERVIAAVQGDGATSAEPLARIHSHRNIIYNRSFPILWSPDKQKITQIIACCRGSMQTLWVCCSWERGAHEKKKMRVLCLGKRKGGVWPTMATAILALSLTLSLSLLHSVPRLFFLFCRSSGRSPRLLPVLSS